MNIDISKFFAVNKDSIQKLESMNKLISLQMTLSDAAKKNVVKEIVLSITRN